MNYLKTTMASLAIFMAATGWLMIAGLGGLGGLAALRRRRQA